MNSEHTDPNKRNGKNMAQSSEHNTGIMCPKYPIICM